MHELTFKLESKVWVRVRVPNPNLNPNLHGSYIEQRRGAAGLTILRKITAFSFVKAVI